MMNEEKQALNESYEESYTEFDTDNEIGEETDETEETEEIDTEETDEIDTSDEDVEDEEQEYYSIEQLNNWNEETDGELDTSKLPPVLAKLINRRPVAEEDTQYKYIDTGLSMEEYEYISEVATARVSEYLKSKGIEFDEYNDKHNALIKNEKNNITTQVKSQKATQARIVGMKQDLERKYGEDFKAVDDKVSEFLRNSLSYNEYQKFMQDFVRGTNKKELYKIYDEAFDKLKNKVKPKAEVKKKQIFPPHSITGGKVKDKPKDKPKELTEHDFLARSNKW